MRLVRGSLATEAGGEAAETKEAATDLLVFVFALPKPQVIEVWKRIRRDRSLNRLPVAILTGKGGDVSSLLGYVKEIDRSSSIPPKHSTERNVDRAEVAKSPENLDRIIEIDGLVINPSSYRVTREGKTIALSTLEFRLLHYLATHPNRLFSRDELMTAVWPAGTRLVNRRIIDLHIYRLRMHIEVDPENPVHLKTKRGVGYLFESKTAQE
jgi:two-component system phosphate regulon response regulator PhoB